MWLGKGQRADTVLADVAVDGLTDTDRARLAFLRALNTLFALADRAGAKRLIDEAGPTATPAARACLDAFGTVYWAMLGHPLAAVESAMHIVPAQLPDAIAARLTAWAIVLAHGDAGRDIEVLPVVETGTRVVTRSFVMSADARVAALLLQGRIGDALDAAEWLTSRVVDLAADIRLLGRGVAGCAALGAGRLDVACALLGPVVEGLTAIGDTVGWRYRYALARTIALAMRGSAKDAVAALADAEQHRHPSWCALDYELARARAWVAASQGEVTLAIAILDSAAAIARENGQLAAEVLCLQTGAQFGSPSGGSRLHELAALLVGPRVHLAARFVAALDASDARELGSVSADFEKLGDPIAALDAAAHAAIICRRRGERGSALGHAARAQALAERCGAVTPALRQAAGPLPLTTREREVVMMIGAGRSNREIAARLTLSIRTVEGHIYRAMAKTGARSRAQLAALVPSSAGRPLERHPA
jgi:DNA-binding CsgD family transcriptional regulator